MEHPEILKKTKRSLPAEEESIVNDTCLSPDSNVGGMFLSSKDLSSGNIRNRFLDLFENGGAVRRDEVVTGFTVSV